MANWYESLNSAAQNINNALENTRGIVKDFVDGNEKKVINNKFAVVDGIYMKNHAIRKDMLRHTWAAYHMLPEHVTEGLGRLEGMIKDVILPNKNEKDLFSFTHDGKSVFSLNINEKYLSFLNGKEIKPAPIKTISKGEYKPWGGKYENGIYPYIDLSDDRSNIENSELYIDKLYEEKDESNQLRYIKEAENKQIFSPKKQYAIVSSSTLEDGFKINNPYPNYDIFDEKDNLGSTNYVMDLGNNNYFDPTQTGSTIPNLKYKTIKLFNERKIDTMVSRFQLSKGINGDYNSPEYIDSTIHEGIGQSHGRSLPTKNKGKNEGGYKREYCRTWTNKYQYDTVDKLIRGTSGKTNDYWNEYQMSESKAEELDKISKKSVLSKNGFVRITPSSTATTEITKCMFSIENLAWKDTLLSHNLTPSQIGPNGGRVMWFPPYDLSFQENVSVNWNENKFIGRGESIYTYTNTMRSGTLGFTLLIDHPSILNRAAEKTKLNTKEYEEDILRFFAGEQVLSAVTYTKKPTEKNTTQSRGTKSITTGEDGNKINFKIYFPFRYSGNAVFYSAGINAILGNLSSYDQDILEYLTEYYEVSNKKEIDEDKKQSTINPCFYSGGTLNSAPPDIEDGESEFHYFNYRVDNDLKQCLENENNYEYNNSDNLNDKFKSLYNAFINKDDELYDGLFNSNNIEIKLEASIGIGEDDEIKRKRYEITRSILLNLFKKRGSNKIKKIDYENIVSVNELLDNNNGNDMEGSKEPNDVNSISEKNNRYIEVTITYDKPEIITLATYADKQKNNRRSSIYSVVASSGTTASTVNNYIENFYSEFEYFNNIAEKKDFAYESIKDKITYFNPAYHSMTPEGFNERLNFLHQCTRQGHTIEGSGSKFKTASNLAFGRPPVCILRIGDFINTKVLIDSISIRYDNGNSVQWDLNHEGIGVQPMYAKISMNIKIIGGQSLDGPVANLNNAVSFNYYANTGVYDKRASVQDGGDKKFISTWSVTPNIEKK